MIRDSAILSCLLLLIICCVRGDIFESLTENEQNDLALYLETKLGVVSYELATFHDPYIFSMELIHPIKAEALLHLDHNGPAPKRYARVAIYNASAPIVSELKVGPLPTSPQTTITLIRNIHWNDRIADTIEYDTMNSGAIDAACALLEPVIKASFLNYSCRYDCEENCLIRSDTAPRGLSYKVRETWNWFVYDRPGFFSHVTGLEMLLKHDGVNLANWKVTKVIYNNQLFQSPQALLNAWNQGTLKKIAHTPIEEPIYSTLQARGTPFPSETVPPPQHFSFGNRFTVTDNRVSWLGWDFSFYVRPFHGMGLWDIRFKNERIIYELSMQDAAAAYSGKASAFQGSTAYYDSSWGMGKYTSPLVVGIDCPLGSELHEHVQWSDGFATTFPNSICVFEHDQAVPLRRHYDYVQQSYGGLGSHVLVIRTIVSVYNYDYVIDYIFHLTGIVETRVMTSGYLQATSWYPSETPNYGSRIQKYIMGSIHEHLLHYKIDIDINGTSNVLKKEQITTEAVKPAWVDLTYQQKVLTHSTVQKEAGFVYNFQTPTSYLVTNVNANNTWGEQRSFRVSSGSYYYNLLSDTTRWKSASWNKYQIAVTKHKDDEPQSSVIWDQTHPGQFDGQTFQKPYLTFDQFLNNENIVNEDIVLWVSTGLFHVPHAEDIPLTTTSYAASIYIRPHNFFDECPTMNLQYHYYRDENTEVGQIPSIPNTIK